MKSKKQNTRQHFEAIIGVDLGDKKHHVCVTDKDGNITCEFTVLNDRQALRKLSQDYPAARVAIEVGTHSPWISRFLEAEGMEVVVANARKLRVIYQNDRKCDELDARMLAKLLRVDPELLSPIQHGTEQTQKDLIAIKLRDTLVRQRTHIIASIRGLLKSVGLRLPACSTPCFHKKAEEILMKHPEWPLTSHAPGPGKSLTNRVRMEAGLRCSLQNLLHNLKHPTHESMPT